MSARLPSRLIEDAVEGAQSDGDLVGVRFHIDDSDLSTEDVLGGAKKVVIRGVLGDISWTDKDEGQKRRTWRFDGRCLRLSDTSGDAADSERCIRTDTYLGRQIGLKSAYVVVVKERGGWAVSPVSTLLSYGRELATRCQTT